MGTSPVTRVVSRGRSSTRPPHTCDSASSSRRTLETTECGSWIEPMARINAFACSPSVDARQHVTSLQLAAKAVGGMAGAWASSSGSTWVDEWHCARWARQKADGEGRLAQTLCAHIAVVWRSQPRQVGALELRHCQAATQKRRIRAASSGVGEPPLCAQGLEIVAATQASRARQKISAADIRTARQAGAQCEYRAKAAYAEQEGEHDMDGDVLAKAAAIDIERYGKESVSCARTKRRPIHVHIKRVAGSGRAKGEDWRDA
eukprot:CAMPEP_0182849764 /NCGR_PEP_ID=MMETSP0006_2-20121128/29732_1 /TAXON_ID=97485 /ORGANISM="Prymnesium parvum, Strain Texoma1" /LENGTH=260 /DNA_ID=CAMNT_0024980319 /DNA_START=409 /DNA_END=1193 /DNA_ORIENTATION=-